MIGSGNNNIGFPVSPIHQLGTSMHTNSINSEICDPGELYAYTKMMVEEYDGHTWKLRSGTAHPDLFTLNNFVLSDSVMNGYTFVDFIAPNNSVSYNNQVITISDTALIKEGEIVIQYRAKANADYPCTSNDIVSGGSYQIDGKTVNYTNTLEQYCVVSGLFNSTEKNKFAISNPVFNNLTMLSKYNGDYKIFSNLGHVVLNGNLSGTQIDVSSLPQGTYFIKLNDGSNQKFMKL